MIKVELTQDEWTRVLNIIASAPYVTAQPLIVRLSEQLQPYFEKQQAEATKKSKVRAVAE